MIKKNSLIGLLGLLVLAPCVCAGTDPLGVGQLEHKSRLVELRSDVVVLSGAAAITEAELLAVFEDIAPSERATFVASPQRIAESVDRLVQFQLMADAGVESGLLEDEAVQARLYNVLNRELAQIHLRRQVEEQTLDDYENIARELYLTQPELFRSARSFDFTHLLITASEREEHEAMALILEARDRLEAGENFDDLVVEFSEDPTLAENNGRLEAVQRSQLDRNFAHALEELPETGDISGPIRSRFGWHLIRLDAVNEREDRSWDDVRDEAVEMARSRHQERLTRRIRADIVGDPATTTVPDLIESIQARYGADRRAGP